MRSGKKTSIVIAVLILLLSAAIGLTAIWFHGHNADANFAPEPAAEEETQAGPEAEAVLFFASDYQMENGWPEPADTLSGILKSAHEDGIVPDNAVLCGDYTNDRELHDYQLSPEDSISEIRSVITTEFGNISSDGIIFVQGNHDRYTESITETGLHEYDDYLIYVLNTENDFPWKQGKTAGCKDKVVRAAGEMRSCFDKLIEEHETRPVFIAGHVPLHFTARTSSRHSTGDNMYASYIFDVVNDAAESLDIVYFFGHNHSKGWDCYLGGSSVFKPAGDTILVPVCEGRTSSTDEFSEEKLNFTYLNAGYVGYYMNCGTDELERGALSQYSAADETLTGTVCEIMPDEVIISRYAADGLHQLGGDGEADPYRNYVDKGLIDASYYETQTGSPQHITRKNAE